MSRSLSIIRLPMSDNTSAGSWRSDWHYRPDLDGVRAIAVAMVVAFHAGLGFSAGFVGVDIFFVLSGYLITGLIFDGQARRTFSLGNFWIRRIRRLVPASLAMVSVTLFAGLWLLVPEDLEALAKNGLAHQLLFSNVFLYQDLDYFSTAAEMRPLLHTWSLAVEEQFYLFFPFVLVVSQGLTRRQKFSACLGLMLISFAACHWIMSRDPSAGFFLLPFRVWEFLAGGVLWCLPPSWHLSRRAALWMQSLGLAIIIAFATCLDDSIVFPGWSALPVVLATMMVLYAGRNHASPLTQFLSHHLAVSLGKMSYSIYLWHWPVIAYLHLSYGVELTLMVKLGAVMISIVLAYVSYHWVEVPFRRPTKKDSLPKTLIRFSVAGLTVILFCVWVSERDGLPERLPQSARHWLAAESSKAFVHRVDQLQIEQDRVPIWGDLDGPRSCLLWGDSHAISLAPGLYESARVNGMKVFQITYSSTAPLLNFSTGGVHGLRDRSPARNAAVIDFVSRHEVQDVVLAAMWEAYLDDPTMQSCLQDTIESLEQAGANVTLVWDVGRHSTDPPRSLAYASWSGDVTAVPEISIDQLHAQRKRFRRCIEGLTSMGVRTIDPADVFVTDDGSWPMQHRGQLLYRDEHHLTVYGGQCTRPLFDRWFRGDKPMSVQQSDTRISAGSIGTKSMKR